MQPLNQRAAHAGPLDVAIISVPDALASIVVAREGYGGMAVSNAIGSNIFDIDLGIGLPFLIKILVDGRPLDTIPAELRLNPPAIWPVVKVRTQAVSGQLWALCPCT